MSSKVEGLTKLKRFQFKLKERLNFVLSYSVLHSLLNDCKNKKGGHNGKLKKRAPMKWYRYTYNIKVTP